MKKAVLAAVAASALLGPTFTAPAVSQPQGNAYGHQPKVCLLTFSSAAARASGADAEVVKAQYVPLPIAVKLEARNDSIADIYTYNETTTFTGVDANIQNPTDPAAGITPDMTTEEVCTALAAYAEENFGDDD